MSNEVPTTVSKFLDREGYTVRTAGGSRSGPAYGVSGIPKSFLIGPEGKILWKGHPRELDRERVSAALEGVSKPTGLGFLRVPVGSGPRMHADLATAVAAAADGRLGEALTEARRVEVAPGPGDAVRSTAAALALAVEDHVALLVGQAEANVERRDALPAVVILRGLASALEGQEAGAAASARLRALRADEAFAAEFKAARAFETAARASIGAKKIDQRTAMQAVVDQHPETLGARRAARRIERK